MSSSTPNFFIVGAPKCGTTALHSALSTHPEVFLSPNKEPHFFARDLEISDGWSVRDENDYLGLFSGAGLASRIGEASPWYLFSKTAADEIYNFNPEAKILILLRDPVDLIHSVHLQHLNTANEDLIDLREALAAEDDRAAGRRLPKRAPFPDCLAYRSIGRLAPQVKRYLDRFGRDQVKVLLLDDLRSDEDSYLREVCRFLEIDEDAQLSFGRRNPSRDLTAVDLMLKRLHYKTRLIPNLQRRIPSSIKNLYRGAVRMLPAMRSTGISNELYNQLADELRGDVGQLSELIQRDLSAWCLERQ
jgi:hypothetical protein